MSQHVDIVASGARVIDKPVLKKRKLSRGPDRRDAQRKDDMEAEGTAYAAAPPKEASAASLRRRVSFADVDSDKTKHTHANKGNTLESVDKKGSEQVNPPVGALEKERLTRSRKATTERAVEIQEKLKKKLVSPNRTK